MAEDLAAWFLRLKGYRIVKRNWRTRHGEIDLIVEKGQTLVFVEVKARRNQRRGRPEEALTPQKQKRLLRLAELFLATFPHPQHEIRLDVITVDFSCKRPKITHYQGVIYG